MLSRRSLIAAPALLLPHLCRAGDFISSPDPFVFTGETGPNFAGNYTTAGKTRLSQVINGAKRNCFLIIAGQSNAQNQFPTPYTPSNGANVINVNPYDGGFYQAQDSLLGCGNQNLTGVNFGNIAGRIADNLINGGNWDVVYLMPIAIGGTTASDWNTGICSNRFQVAINRYNSRGITPSMINAIIWMQGETDNTNGTSQSAYAASLGSIITNVQALGFTGRFFVAEETLIGGAVSSAVQSAQLAIVNNGAGIYAGPNLDALTGLTNRQADLTHFNDVGAASAATLWATALHASGAPF